MIASKLNEKRMDFNQRKDICEIFFTRHDLDKNSQLVQNIRFQREKLQRSTEFVENLILSSRKSIYVMMYILTNNILSQALIKAHNNGIEVFVVVDNSMRISSQGKLSLLSKVGIPVKVFDIDTMHHKMCLIDVPNYDDDKNKKKNDNKISKKFMKEETIQIPDNGIIINGSMNWTNEGLMRNRENFAVISNAVACQSALAEFLIVWKNAKDFED
ncbi:CLUMA_CG000114, isoform A [Clunio marinus]|uniref:Mitochondrial cardiolipin hydrolase n=1 Tax=Clunio marinus TaxID=568069 RepID=A0A1J1HFE0_9DIPT|nr:CLUMA_CG000114, isoform A [Clunio marinus]